MSQEEGKTYVAPLPFNWAKMTVGGQRQYLCSTHEVLARLGDIMALTEEHLTNETTSGIKELQDHFTTIQHVVSMSSSHVYSQVEACGKEAIAVFSEEEKKLKDVHTEHCCAKHGCKYGDDKRCSVESGIAPQSFPCEYCDDGYNGDYD